MNSTDSEIFLKMGRIVATTDNREVLKAVAFAFRQQAHNELSENRVRFLNRAAYRIEQFLDEPANY